MMSTTCHNLEFGRNGSCGCSFSSSFDRFSLRNQGKRAFRTVNRGYGARKLVCFRRGISRCRVFSTEIPKGTSLLNELTPGLPPVLDVMREPSNLISLTDMFEVVADDLLTLNKNLLSIVGAENPVLMSAAEQIFGAGGKRMRPALVFLASRATAEIAGLTELTKEHRRLAEIIEMIHTASLIHDDVLDESDMRRGKETVHQMYGTRVAVLAGDFMFAQSSWYLANLENLEVIKLISQVIKDFASGEIKQASSLFDCDVGLDEYLIKSYYKTASLIAASTKGAAIFSGVDSDVSEQMYQYGYHVGGDEPQAIKKTDMSAWLRRIGQWKPIAKEAIGRAAVFVKFLCLLHVTDTYIFSPRLVVGPSMFPTLNLFGDVLLTETISIRLGKVGPGDVILARSPDNPRKIVSKRIVGMEDDIVTFLVDPNRSDISRTIVVPKGHVWIQGDNIYASTDSRHFGPIPYGLIQSKVLCRVWPLDGFGSLRN